MTAERVQKILSHAGYGSRRGCEKLIEAGRVTINGKIATLGNKADSGKDEIKVDGNPITLPDSFTYIALYKPRGVLSSTKSHDQLSTVLDLVPASERLYPVGRLDLNSEGLLLLTNDGDLTNKLTHPRYGHEKEYRVLVAKHPDRKQLDTWRRGIVMSDGYQTKPVNVRIEKLHGKGAWLRVVMTEGRKRQIRETAALIGLPVVKLIRVRIASLQLGKLKHKQWRHLNKDEIKLLTETPIKPKGYKKRE